MSAKDIVLSIYPDAGCNYAPLTGRYHAGAGKADFSAKTAREAWRYAAAELCSEKACRALVRRKYPDAQIREYPDMGCKVFAVGLQDLYVHKTPLDAWRAAARIANHES